MRLKWIPELLTGATPEKRNPAGGTAGLALAREQITSIKDSNMELALLSRGQTATSSTARASRAAMTEEQQLNAWLARSATEVFSAVVLVTPSLAKALLERNTGNRPVIWSAPNRSVLAYADAMRRGEWVLNGEPIIVSSSGELNDGQHRLSAVVESNVPVQMHIVFGVERDTRHTVDQGVARSPGHILAMYGEKNANQLATALQFLWAQDGEVSFNARPSTDQLLDALRVHPEVRGCVSAVSHLINEYRLSSGYIAAAHYRCLRHNPFSAQQWLDGLTNGLNIQNVNSPVARLRKMYGEHAAKRAKKDRTEQAALYIKGYNLFIRGRTGAFSFRANGPAPETFPVAGA